MSGKKRFVSVGTLVACSFLLAFLCARVEAQTRGLTAPKSLVQLLEKEDRDCVVSSGGLRKTVTVQPIRLTTRSGQQILVKGSGLCLCGAQNCLFWIYRKTGSKYELLLTGAGSTRVRTGRQSAKGYRDVISESHASANETIIRTYRYDSSGYRLQSCVNRAFYNDNGEFTKTPTLRPCEVEQKGERADSPLSELLNRKLSTVDNRSLKLSDFSDRTIVLILFASWCGPCRLNLPTLIDLQRSYVTHPIQVIGLVSNQNDKDIAYLRKFVREQEISFPVVWDTDSFGAALVKASHGRSVLPQTFVIDASGAIRKHLSGFNPSMTPQILRETLDQIGQKPAKSP